MEMYVICPCIIKTAENIIVVYLTHTPWLIVIKYLHKHILYIKHQNVCRRCYNCSCRCIRNHWHRSNFFLVVVETGKKMHIV